MLNGILNVYKEKGFTSFDVIAKLRIMTKQKKIGHTGTLDPDAQGVLPVCFGKATKVCDMLTEKNKVYEAVLRLGIETDTQDMTGKIISEKNVNCNEKEVYKTILDYVGDYEQIPPMYSALKVNGQKLCDLAREGIEVERKARKVHLYSIEILSMDLPTVKMRVHCSKGTYIRTLCHDIGQKLGCGGVMESLIRTKVSVFCIENAYRLDEIEKMIQEEKLNEKVMQIDQLFLDYPSLTAKEEYDIYIQNGNRMKQEYFLEVFHELQAGKFRVYDTKDNFIGIYGYDEDRMDFKPLKIFKE